MWNACYWQLIDNLADVYGNVADFRMHTLN